MAHLSVRSYYSLLSALMSPEEIAKTARANGMKAVALTDRHRLHGAQSFERACIRESIKPIYGLEITFAIGNQKSDSLVLAKNAHGYQALIDYSAQLLSGKILSVDDLASHQKDLVVVFYSEKGPFEHALIHGDWEALSNTLQFLKSKIPDMVIGISHQESAFFKPKNKQLMNLAKENDILCIALPKVYYRYQDDVESLRILNAIQKGLYYHDKTLDYEPGRHFLTREELLELYGEMLVDNAEKVADLCCFELSSLKTQLPSFPIEKTEVSSDVYLKQLSHFALKHRLKGTVPATYRKRLDYELSVITEMDFSDYFLIVYDLVRFAKKSGIYVGPGRGSSASSLVAYALGITDVDPIVFDLYFERFLNPDRKGMPDIDIDFPDDRRDEVIAYLRKKYGDDHVAHIITYGNLKARQAFRDVARVFQVPTYRVDQLSKQIRSADLEKAYQENSQLQNMIAEEETLQKVYHHALKIQNIPRHTSLHAAGIVLSEKALRDCVPYFYQEDDGSAVIQYDMDYIESMGLVKIDLLGLRNLKMISRIKEELSIPMSQKVPFDDKKTFELLSRGETSGIFQLESDGMTKLLMQMKPNRFMDLVDAIALYRPGPMQNIPVYLENRRQKRWQSDIHPVYDEISATTYGILIYQEQIMQIAQKMAGFSLARADILRKAMSDKNYEEIHSLEEEFIAGAIKNGHTKEKAKHVFALIERFADYGFNKAHSVSYAMVAYEMAYFKAHYPLVFYRQLLSSILGNDQKTQDYLDEMRFRQIKLVSVNINVSEEDYVLKDNALILPLNLVKGISRQTAFIVKKEREEKGLYKDFIDAISRLSLQGLSRHHFLALIHAGAFDVFTTRRQSLEASLDGALGYTRLITVEKDGKKMLNPSLVSSPKMEIVEENLQERLQAEKDALGFYFSEHPSTVLQKKHRTDLIADVIVSKTNRYRIIAMIERVKRHKTKKGDQMAFLEISDASGRLDVVIFPRLYENTSHLLEKGALILIRGQMKEERSMIVNDLYRFKLNEEGGKND